jgi:hypothetical protein
MSAPGGSPVNVPLLPNNAARNAVPVPPTILNIAFRALPDENVPPPGGSPVPRDLSPITVMAEE